MKTLVIYDNKGTIITQVSGEPEPIPPVGVPYLFVDSEQLVGKTVIKIDVITDPNNHALITENIPLSQQQKKIEELEQTLADLTELVLMGGE